MSERTNEDRRGDARTALELHVRANNSGSDQELEADPKSCLADLLTNLMHLAKEMGVDWKEATDTATMNFEAETGPCGNCGDDDHGEEECDEEIGS